MRLGHVLRRPALLEQDSWVDIAASSSGRFPSIDAALASWAEFREWAGELPSEVVRQTLDHSELTCPLVSARQVFGAGLNYAEHRSMGSLQRGALPVFFTKFPSCLAGPFDDIPLATDLVDFEAELVVVIGAAAVDVSPADAWDHVAALAVGQDISARGVQRAGQLSLAKSFPGFGPIGPWLVSVDEIENPKDLRITCTVNGRTVQDARTTDMLTPVAELIALLSSVTGLLPGDVLFSGTPARSTPSSGESHDFLAPGDIVRTEIEGIGVIENRCVPCTVPLESRRRRSELAVLV